MVRRSKGSNSLNDKEAPRWKPAEEVDVPLQPQLDRATRRKSPDCFEDLEEDPLPDNRKYEEESQGFSKLHMLFFRVTGFTLSRVEDAKLAPHTLFVTREHFI